MTRQQNFLFGLAVGATAAMTGKRLARNRHALDFSGRNVIITGGSRGLGLVMARQLAGEGARLCLLARDEAELDRARAQLEAGGATDVLTMRPKPRRRIDGTHAWIRCSGPQKCVAIAFSKSSCFMSSSGPT